MRLNRNKTLLYGVIGGAVLLLTSTIAVADVPREQNAHPSEQSTEYKADNSGRNVRDRRNDSRTPDHQAMTGKQNEVLARIRKEIVANDNLSTYAKNVKIHVANGTVTLRGPVRTAEEKNWIAKASARVADGYQVVDQLEVTTR